MKNTEDSASQQSTQSSNKKYSAVQHWHDYYRLYLDAMARYGALNKEQLSLVTGHTEATVRTVIRNLSKAGYVLWHRTAGTVLYYITPQGLAMTAYVNFARSQKNAFGLAQHDFVVNSLVTNLIRSSNPPTNGLIQWQGSLEAKAELADYYGGEVTERSQKLNYLPDAYIEYVARSGQDDRFGIYPVVLEIDMGTEPTPRLLKKLESGVRTLALRHDGGKHNILWVLVGSEGRAARVFQAMQPVYLELRSNLPSGRTAKVLLRAVDLENIANEHIISGGLDLATGQHATLVGQQTGERELKEFLGVGIVYDKIKKEYVIRTQIPALKG
jgi:hypothetical protein